MAYGIYEQDGTKRTEWATKKNAIAAARQIKSGVYVVNEKNAEIVFTAKH